MLFIEVIVSNSSPWKSHHFNFLNEAVWIKVNLDIEPMLFFVIADS